MHFVLRWAIRVTIPNASGRADPATAELDSTATLGGRQAALARVALRGAAMLELMQDDRTTPTVDDPRDDAAATVSADASESVGSEAREGSEPVAEQSVPDSAGVGPEQSVQTGPLARLFMKVSASPIEVLQALQDLSEMIGERVLREMREFRREMREFRRESKARHDVQDAKLEAIDTKHEAGMAAQNARFDALYKLYDGLRKDMDGMRKQMRLMVALITIQLAFIGILITVGLVNGFSVSKASAPPAAVDVQAPAVEVEEAQGAESEPGSSTPAAAPVGEDAARLQGDPAEESSPTLSSGR